MTFLVRKEIGGSLDLVGRGRKLGTVAVAFKFESLLVDSVRDTSHFLRSPSSLFSALNSRMRRQDFHTHCVGLWLSSAQTHRSVAIQARSRL